MNSRTGRHTGKMGTCGACERPLHAVAMDQGTVVAKHGYARRGHGEAGECAGSRELPHETSPGVARKVAAAWDRRRDDLAARLRAIDAGEVTDLREYRHTPRRQPPGFAPGKHVRTDGHTAFGGVAYRVDRVEITVFATGGCLETLVWTPASCGPDDWAHRLRAERDDVQRRHEDAAKRAAYHHARVAAWVARELPPADARAMAKAARKAAEDARYGRGVLPAAPDGAP